MDETEELETAHEPGSLVRSFTPEEIDRLISNTEVEVKAAVKASDLDLGSLLVSKLSGLRMVRALY